MSGLELGLWLTVMGVGFAGSALFSGMETGCYCLNRVRLHVLASHGDRAAVRLQKQVSEPTSLLSTLLIGNNVANYMGTAALAVVLDATGLTGGQQMAANALIVTPVLFVVGETLPKDLFSAHADALMYRLQPVLRAARWLFTVTLLVPVVGLFSGLLMRAIGRPAGGAGSMQHPRRQVSELVKEGLGLGLLSDAQSTMVEQVLASAGLTVGRFMTPWRRVRRLAPGDGMAAVRRHAMAGAVAWLPVVEAGAVLGAVEVVRALAGQRSGRFTARSAMQPALFIPADTPLRRALAEMRAAGAPWAVVTDRDGRPVGVVTRRDLLEPITGRLPR